MLIASLGFLTSTGEVSRVFDGPPTRSATSFGFGGGRAIYLGMANGRHRDNTRRLNEILDGAGVRPLFPISRDDGSRVKDVETYVFRNGNLTIIALQRDFAPISNRGSGETVLMALPRPVEVYDLRAQHSLGRTSRLRLELGQVAPTLLALSEAPVPPPEIVAPQRVVRGANAKFLIRSNAASPGVVHLDVIDPEGNLTAPYSENMLVGREAKRKLLPLALNDKLGVWKLRVTDRLNGETTVAELQVEP